MPEPIWPWEAVTTDEKKRTRARHAPAFYIACCVGAGLLLYVAFREASPLWSRYWLHWRSSSNGLPDTQTFRPTRRRGNLAHPRSGKTPLCWVGWAATADAGAYEGRAAVPLETPPDTQPLRPTRRRGNLAHPRSGKTPLCWVGWAATADAGAYEGRPLRTAYPTHKHFVPRAGEAISHTKVSVFQ